MAAVRFCVAAEDGQCKVRARGSCSAITYVVAREVQPDYTASVVVETERQATGTGPRVAGDALLQTLGMLPGRRVERVDEHAVVACEVHDVLALVTVARVIKMVIDGARHLDEVHTQQRYGRAWQPPHEHLGGAAGRCLE